MLTYGQEAMMNIPFQDNFTTGRRSVNSLVFIIADGFTARVSGQSLFGENVLWLV